MFWTRAEALIFLKRKIFFLLTLFLLFNFLNKSHNSPIRNLLFPVIKIKIPAHPHLHNSFERLENVKHEWINEHWQKQEWCAKILCYFNIIHSFFQRFMQLGSKWRLRMQRWIKRKKKSNSFRECRIHRQINPQRLTNELQLCQKNVVIKIHKKVRKVQGMEDLTVSTFSNCD